MGGLIGQTVVLVAVEGNAEVVLAVFGRTVVQETADSAEHQILFVLVVETDCYQLAEPQTQKRVSAVQKLVLTHPSPGSEENSPAVNSTSVCL